MSKRRARRRLRWIAGSAIAAAAILAGTLPALAGSADDGIEKRAVLRSSDFPAGWKKTGRREPTASGMDVCADLDEARVALVGKSTRSPQFERPDTENVLVTSAVAVVRSAKEAKGYLDPFREPDAVPCMEARTESRLTAAGFTAVGVYVTPTVDVPSGADDAAGFGVEITVTAPATTGGAAQTAVIYQDLLVVRVGRAVASFEFLNPVKPLPDQGELVDVVIGRLEDGLAG